MNIRFRLSLLAALLCFGAAAHADELVLKHDDFRRTLQSWSIPSYWSGTVKLVEDGGRKVMRLAGARRGKAAFGRAIVFT